MLHQLQDLHEITWGLCVSHDAVVDVHRDKDNALETKDLLALDDTALREQPFNNRRRGTISRNIRQDGEILRDTD